MATLTKLLASPIIATGLFVSTPETLSIGDFLAESNLDIYVEDGIATLRGYAGTESASLRAELIASNIEGVIEVRNFASYS